MSGSPCETRPCRPVCRALVFVTCWQIDAYLASTLAFSIIARYDGLCVLIFRTHRHLAKRAPSRLYCAHRSPRLSRPTHSLISLIHYLYTLPRAGHTQYTTLKAAGVASSSQKRESFDCYKAEFNLPLNLLSRQK